MPNATLTNPPQAGFSINRVVTTSVSQVPTATPTPNPNNTAFITTDLPLNSSASPYAAYVDLQSVVADYGTNSDTANFASILFQATPNIVNAGGVLWIVPYNGAVSATSGEFVTVSIIPNIANFALISNGACIITIDGTAYDVLQMDFTGVTTVQQIANIISERVKVYVNVTVNGGVITFTSKTFGSTSSITFSSPPSGTDLTGEDYLDTAAGSGVAGVNSSGETLPQAIARTRSVISYCGVSTNLDMGNVAQQAADAYVAGIDSIWLQNVISSLSSIATLALSNAQANQENVRYFIYTTYNQRVQAKAGAMTVINGVDFTASNTTKTSQGKIISGLLPDPILYDTLYTSLQDAGCDFYSTIEGSTNFCFSTRGNNFSDNVFNQIALAYYCQYALFNFLRVTNTKTPQTESGMIAAKNSVINVLVQFVRNGYIAPGKWNSPQTFGDRDAFLTAIADDGYYVYSLPIADQLQSQREQRIAPTIQVACKAGGAMQSFNLTVTVEN